MLRKTLNIVKKINNNKQMNLKLMQVNIHNIQNNRVRTRQAMST